MMCEICSNNRASIPTMKRTLNTTINRSSGAKNDEHYTQFSYIRKEIGGIDADPVMPWSKGSQMLCCAHIHEKGEDDRVAA